MGISEILLSKEEFIAGKGTSEDKISLAESILNLKFSSEYKEYLQVFGLAMCNGHELTGIGNIERLNVVSVTKQMKERNHSIPEDWYVIEDTYMDNMIVWQDANGHIYYKDKKEFDSLAEFLSEI